MKTNNLRFFTSAVGDQSFLFSWDFAFIFEVALVLFVVVQKCKLESAIPTFPWVYVAPCKSSMATKYISIHLWCLLLQQIERRPWFLSRQVYFCCHLFLVLLTVPVYFDIVQWVLKFSCDCFIYGFLHFLKSHTCNHIEFTNKTVIHHWTKLLGLTFVKFGYHDI